VEKAFGTPIAARQETMLALQETMLALQAK
jgi:hypothetical protein